MRLAQPFFPELNYSLRKVTRPDACASAGLSGHISSKDWSLAQQVALRNLVGFRMRPSLGRHFQ